jgi:excisionase family DNA binding protein
MTDPRPHLRALAEALPTGSAVTVPREWLLELLADAPPAPVQTSAILPAAESADRLLTIDEAAARLGVTKDWIYHHRKDLPFAVKLGRKVLRFSAQKLERYLEARRRSTAS